MKYIFATTMYLTLVNISLAQQVSEIRPLSFGTIAVIKNSTPGFLRIDELGNFSYSDNFVIIELPNFGIYRLSGYPANAMLNIDGFVTQAETSSTLASVEQFTMTSVNIRPTLNTLSDGTAEFRVGGEFVTSGSGNMNFNNTEFTSQLIITVNF